MRKKSLRSRGIPIRKDGQIKVQTDRQKVTCISTHKKSSQNGNRRIHVSNMSIKLQNATQLTDPREIQKKSKGIHRYWSRDTRSSKVRYETSWSLVQIKRKTGGQAGQR